MNIFHLHRCRGSNYWYFPIRGLQTRGEKYLVGANSGLVRDNDMLSWCALGQGVASSRGGKVLGGKSECVAATRYVLLTTHALQVTVV